LVSVFTFHVWAEPRADFLIIEKPSRLTILDEYETPLSESKRKKLPRWAPMRIVEEKALLGDMITEAAHVRLGNEDYYLLMDEEGNYEGRAMAGKISRLRNCRPLYDTVTVSRAGAIRFEGSTASRLPKGAELLRAFESGGRWFCLWLEEPSRYKWVRGSAQALSKREIPKEKKSFGISPSTAQRIRRHFESVNETYARYFSYFSSRSGKDKSVPRWEAIREDGQVIRYALSSAPGVELEKSTEHLVDELRGRLVSEDVEVVHEKNAIEVRAIKE
jgi:hypothetical protein